MNDSLWVQFSDARVNGAAAYAIGTTAGLLVNLATDGSANSLNAWGWQNTAYWLSQTTTVTFPTTGAHTVRLQIREDGVQFDQIVLSPGTYLNSAPGTVSNDHTIVQKP
jgi:Gylcosyl hydrolase family 115 C-terminal domain